MLFTGCVFADKKIVAVSTIAESRLWAEKVAGEIEKSNFALQYWLTVQEMVSDFHPLKVYLMYGVTMEEILQNIETERSKILTFHSVNCEQTLKKLPEQLPVARGN